MRSKLAAIIFLVGVVFVVLIALVPGMVPSWTIDGETLSNWA